MIAEFARRYPGISFEFDLTPRRVDLVAEPVDVAIRMGELPNSHLIARQLARLPRYLYASPRYLQLSGEPSQPADLTQHECLLLRGQANTRTLHHAAETVEYGSRHSISYKVLDLDTSATPVVVGPRQRLKS